MNITDELREYAGDFYLFRYKDVREKLDAIADRIDAEYQKAEDEWKAKGGQSWLHGYEECRLELMEGNEAITASLEEAGWYRVLDADEQPIHIGDEMEHVELGYVCEVIAVGIDCFIAWNTHANRYCQYDSKLFRHHHEPTVEDVLEEYRIKYYDLVTDVECKNITNEEYAQGISSLNAEYAAKLQLKETE